jgi:PAS domain S-box-containing protein
MNSSPNDSETDVLLLRISPLIGRLVAVIGGIVLVGWLLNIERFKMGFFPGDVTMKASAAICFVLLGLALNLRPLPYSPKRTTQPMAVVLAIAVLSIATLTLAEYAFGWHFPALFSDPPSVASPFPNRMGPNTAICLVLASISMLLLSLSPRWYRLSQWLALIVAVIALQALVGYAYGVRLLYQITATTSMSLSAAIALLLLALGILGSTSRYGIMRTLTGSFEGSRMARWLIPVAILLPPLLGWIALKGIVLGIYNPVLVLSLLVMAMLCVFVAVIWMTAALLNRSSSERERVSYALNEVREQLIATLEIATDGFFALDNRWQLIYINQKAEQICGRSRLEMLHQDFWQIFPEALGTVVEQQFDQAMATQKVTEFETILPNYGIWVEMRVFPSHRGLAVYCRDVTRSRRVEQKLRRSEARLSSFVESNVIGVLIGDVEGGIHEANDELLRIIGYTRDDLDNGHLRWTDLTPPEYLQLDAERVAEARLRGACTPYEKRYIHKDGTQVPVLVGYGLVGEERWESIAFILDLTELKQLEATLRQQAEELTQANRLKDEFLTVLSHELRTPLNPILGWSKLLQTRNYDRDRTLKALQTIERNARVQAQLVEDLLDVSRIFRGEMKLHITPVNLPELMAQTVSTVRPSAAEKQIQIYCQINPISNLCMGDPRRLQQLIWNLLSNAIKFTPEGGRVDVRLEMEVDEWMSGWVDGMTGRRNNGMTGKIDEEHSPTHLPIHPVLEPFERSTLSSFAQITVTDTGIGISLDFLPHIFDSFRQADSSSTRSQGGLGLGLAIAHHITEIHGGRIWAESEGRGKGSRFVVQLPLQASRDAHGQHHSRVNGNSYEDSNSYQNGKSVTLTGGDTSGKLLDSAEGVTDSQIHQTTLSPCVRHRLPGVKILLVEDEVDNQQYLEAVLTQQGASVRVADGAVEALQMLTQSLPDILISDIAMPNMDGNEMLCQIRQQSPESGGHLPAIALTAYADQSHRQEAMAAGYQHFLAKPIEPETLITAIEQLCAGAISSAIH